MTKNLVSPNDYLKLLNKYGFIPTKHCGIFSELKLKDIKFKNAPEVKKALEGLDISKCDFVVLSTTLTKKYFEGIWLTKPATNLMAIKHYVKSYTPSRGDLPIGVVDNDVAHKVWYATYGNIGPFNYIKKSLEEFFNKTLPEAIKAARELWEPSMKDFAMEIYKRNAELEAAKRGLQETKNRFYKSLKKKQQLLKDFKD